MNDTQQTGGAGVNTLSLHALLETIEQETLPALEADRQFAQKQSLETIQQKVPYVSFQLAGVKMMLPLASVAEVGHLPDVTALPHLPAWINGIVQLQGEIIPVINLLTLFQMDPGPRFISSKSFLLIDWPDYKICLVVEKISGTLNLDLQQEKLAPLVQQDNQIFGGLSAYVQGVMQIGDDRVYLLNLTGMKDSPLLNNWKEEYQV